MKISQDAKNKIVLVDVILLIMSALIIRFNVGGETAAYWGLAMGPILVLLAVVVVITLVVLGLPIVLRRSQKKVGILFSSSSSTRDKLLAGLEIIITWGALLLITAWIFSSV